MTELRIVSWNMAHRAENWAELRALLGEGPAVALVQEALDPAGLLPDGLADPFSGGVPPDPWETRAGFARGWCTAVAPTVGLTCEQPTRLSLESATGEELVISQPGSYAAARVSADGHDPIGVVSLYGIWDRQDGIGSYSEATLHRTISDLTPWLHRPPPGGLIIAGDFNCYLDYGDWWDERYMTVFERLSAYGVELLGPKGGGPLEGCPCRLGDGCRHVRTYAHQYAVEGKPFQVDFVLGNSAARDRLLGCEVAEGAAFATSDHLPIVTTLRWG